MTANSFILIFLKISFARVSGLYRTTRPFLVDFEFWLSLCFSAGRIFDFSVILQFGDSWVHTAETCGFSQPIMLGQLLLPLYITGVFNAIS